MSSKLRCIHFRKKILLVRFLLAPEHEIYDTILLFFNLCKINQCVKTKHTLTSVPRWQHKQSIVYILNRPKQMSEPRDHVYNHLV